MKLRFLRSVDATLRVLMPHFFAAAILVCVLWSATGDLRYLRWAAAPLLVGGALWMFRRMIGEWLSTAEVQEDEDNAAAARMRALKRLQQVAMNEEVARTVARVKRMQSDARRDA